MTAKKKAPGANIPEAQRHTVQVKLRTQPEVADKLTELAERWGESKGAVVERLLRAGRWL